MPLSIPSVAARDDWETPAWLFDPLLAEFDFTVDAMAQAHNHRLERYWSPEQNGLIQDWTGERVWVNSPWPRRMLAAVAAKAYQNREVTVTAMLTPVKCDQGWWHDYAMKGEVRFVKTRVAFRGAAGCYAGPIAIIIWGAGTPGKMVTIDPRARQASLFEGRKSKKLDAGSFVERSPIVQPVTLDQTNMFDIEGEDS